MTDLIEEFKKRFEKKPDHIFFSPGRINLIGEHIDYNGGRVMPCAISLGTYLAVSKNTEDIFRFQCLNFPETGAIPVQNGYRKTGKEWFNYPLGVIDHFVRLGNEFAGLDLLFYGNLPIGAGLSSSASIEVLMAYTLSELFSLRVPKLEIATVAKKIENEFIGMNCGIMDQFAVTFGEAQKAILLNCDTLDYQLLPFKTEDYQLCIINTNKARKLTDSKYNERFAECREALTRLQKGIQAKNLCEISPAVFEANRYLISDDVLEKRALHVISENLRVHDAAKSLEAGRVQEFGKLMYASHLSLKELYEVSGPELDTIVEFCLQYDHCIGARMTGAGFGGCAIALVKNGKMEEFSKLLGDFYEARIGYKADVFESNIGDGVKRIS